MRNERLRILLALCLTALPALADPKSEAAAIRATILKGAEAAMRGDAAGIMSHYAKDILLSYPGTPDQDYDTLFKVYAEPRPAGMSLRTAPTFDEVFVSGDLAVLRLNWTTTIATSERETTRQARDLQVWRRERDGTWMFARGMHFRNSPPVAVSGADALIVIPDAHASREKDAAAIRAAIETSTGDALLTTPGIPDQTLAGAPIEEILVSGGLAVVRLGDGRQTREMQVWIRDGARWKLARAMRLP